MPIPNFLKSKWLRNSLLLVFGLVILILFFGSRLLYANPLFQTWVKHQIASDTHGEFQFTDINGGFISAHLENLSLNLKGTSFNVQNVQTSKMKASFDWIPLLKNKLLIRSLTMDGGQLNIQLNGGAAEQITLPVSKSFALRDGTVNLSNFSKWNLKLENCDLDATQSGSEKEPVISGSISAEKATIGGLPLEKISGQFRLEKGRFWLKKLSAVLPGKSAMECSGSYTLDGKPLLDLEFSLATSDIKSLLHAVDFSQRFAGKAKISLKAKGQFTPSVRSLNGGGKAILTRIEPDVTLPKLPAFNDAPILKRVRDIDDLEGTADFQLSQNNINITQTDLKNDDVHITGTATIGYDRSLSSRFLFTGNEKIIADMPALARRGLPYDKDGNVLIPFQLKPDTRDPTVDLGNLINQVISGSLNPFNILK